MDGGGCLQEEIHLTAYFLVLKIHWWLRSTAAQRKPQQAGFRWTKRKLGFQEEAGPCGVHSQEPGLQVDHGPDRNPSNVKLVIKLNGNADSHRGNVFQEKYILSINRPYCKDLCHKKDIMGCRSLKPNQPADVA